MQIFDINLPFLKSTLSKTYYKIANSIIIVLDLESIESLENFFKTVEIIVKEGVQSKLSVIAWKPTDKRNSLVSSNFADENSKKNSVISNSSFLNKFESNQNKQSRISINFNNCNSSDRKRLIQLYTSFKNFCKTYKIIVLHISNLSDLSMENEFLKNFIGYLLLKKFNTPDTRNFLIKSHLQKKDYALMRRLSKEKRNSITLADGGTIIPGVTNNSNNNFSTSTEKQKIANKDNIHLINSITNKVLLKRRHTEKF